VTDDAIAEAAYYAFASPIVQGLRASARALNRLASAINSKAPAAGRGTLVRQALARLVRFPAIAGSVSAAERAGLATCEEPGVGLLRELLDDLLTHPLTRPAELLERWAARRDGKHLARLLEREEIIVDEAGAALELRAALMRIADFATERRLAVLERISRARRLDDHELVEFQSLVRRRPRS